MNFEPYTTDTYDWVSNGFQRGCERDYLSDCKRFYRLAS